MKRMIQLAILAAVLMPTAALADPDNPAGRPTKPHPPSPPRPTPPPKPGPPSRPTPPPKPAPTPDPQRHHQPPVVWVVRPVYPPAAPVVRWSSYVPQTRPAASKEPALTTRQFLNDRDGLAGQRVAVFGRVTQAVNGMSGLNYYYILDGTVRCELLHDAFSPSTYLTGVGHYVTVTGTVVNNRDATGSADLVQ